jgi:hypothetical protein
MTSDELEDLFTKIAVGADTDLSSAKASLSALGLTVAGQNAELASAAASLSALGLTVAGQDAELASAAASLSALGLTAAGQNAEFASPAASLSALGSATAEYNAGLASATAVFNTLRSTASGYSASLASAAASLNASFTSIAGYNADLASAAAVFNTLGSTASGYNASLASAAASLNASFTSIAGYNADLASAAASLGALGSIASGYDANLASPTTGLDADIASMLGGFNAAFAAIAATCADHIRAQLRVDSIASVRELAASFGPLQLGANELLAELLAENSAVIEAAAGSCYSTVLGVLQSIRVASPFEPALTDLELHNYRHWLKVFRLANHSSLRHLQAYRRRLQRVHSRVAAVALRAHRLPQRAVGRISLRRTRSCCRSKASSSSDDDDSNSLPSVFVFGHYRKGKRGGEKTNEVRSQFGPREGHAASCRRPPLERQIRYRDSARHIVGAPLFRLSGSSRRRGSEDAPNQRRSARARPAFPCKRYPADSSGWPAARPGRAVNDGAHS